MQRDAACNFIFWPLICKSPPQKASPPWIWWGCRWGRSNLDPPTTPLPHYPSPSLPRLRACNACTSFAGPRCKALRAASTRSFTAEAFATSRAESMCVLSAASARIFACRKSCKCQHRAALGSDDGKCSPSAKLDLSQSLYQTGSDSNVFHLFLSWAMESEFDCLPCVAPFEDKVFLEYHNKTPRLAQFFHQAVAYHHFSRYPSCSASSAEIFCLLQRSCASARLAWTSSAAREAFLPMAIIWYNLYFLSQTILLVAARRKGLRMPKVTCWWRGVSLVVQYALHGPPTSQAPWSNDAIRSRKGETDRKAYLRFSIRDLSSMQFQDMTLASMSFNKYCASLNWGCKPLYWWYDQLLMSRYLA